jgi:hypothetical protein
VHQVDADAVSSAFSQRLGEFVTGLSGPIDVGLKVDVALADRTACSIAGKLSSPFSSAAIWFPDTEMS